MFFAEIHIKGKMDPKWSDWFEEMQIEVNTADVTILRGNLTDKAAVYGVLSRLSSLGITLISITCEEMNMPISPDQ